MAPYVPVLAALIGAALGATATALYNFVMGNLSRRKKQEDLYRLVLAELLNLARHCQVSAREIGGSRPIRTVDLRKAKYREAGFLLLDSKEIYLLNENLCQDIMQLILRSRNNDIELDALIEIKKASAEDTISAEQYENIVDRLERTARNAEKVVDLMRKHWTSPERYNEPISVSFRKGSKSGAEASRG